MCDMVETLLTSSLVREMILPFLLIFSVTFAILQKTKILGDGKKQIDAIVALVIGLIVITFGYATNLINSLIPFLAVSIVVILIFMILYGMTFQGRDELKIHQGIQITVGILAALGLLIVLLVSTGAWDYLYDRFFLGGDSSSLVTNVIFIVVIVAVVLVATLTNSGSGSSGSSEKKKD